jgi:hypothetical protein
MCSIVQTLGKTLAVSLFSAENKTYEAQRKTSNHGRSRRMASGPHRQDDGQVFSRRACETFSQRREDHRRREEERSRQAFKIFSSCFGSSPYPSARIARAKSSSRGVANSPRSTSISSFFRFLSAASCGRRPGLPSSAMTSRMSSSFVPFAMFKARNDSGFLPTMQLSSLANTPLRLTGANAPAYTCDSRWVRISTRRASSHSACSVGKIGSPSGISEISKSSREMSAVTRSQK